MNNPVLGCYGISKIYTDGRNDIAVLSQIDLEVSPGEMVAIIGSSGSGKSTLLHLMGGLDKPSKGKVHINGRDVHFLSEAEKCRVRNESLGFVYQFHHLLPEFSALENVGMPLLIQGVNRKKIKEKASHLLEQVGLEKRMTHRLGQLSGGERQRVAIARALVSDPLCVLADEPTGNLDPVNAEKVLQLFYELQKNSKTSVVLVTHDPQVAANAQRVLRIEGGRLLQVDKSN